MKWDENVDVFILVIAHPDDESMFFCPTIQNILQADPSHYSRFHIICLSNGDYNHLGHIREKELVKAAHIILGIPRQNIHVINDLKNMPDDPKVSWDSDIVADTVESFLNTICSKHKMTNIHMTASISNSLDAIKESLNVMLFTFDSGGVSGHSNHTDTWKGIEHLISRSKLMEQQNKHRKEFNGNYTHVHVRAYQLQTIYFPIRKYFPPLDGCIVWLQYLYFLFYENSNPSKKCFFSFAFRPFMVWNAMKAHNSQFVWYRKLSVLWSRYTYVNTWTEMGSAYLCTDGTRHMKKLK